jgi:hypothetical protein
MVIQERERLKEDLGIEIPEDNNLLSYKVKKGIHKDHNSLYKSESSLKQRWDCNGRSFMYRCFSGMNELQVNTRVKSYCCINKGCTGFRFCELCFLFYA